ncbi:MAG: hypothetical protein ACE5RH_00935 [Nitrosarchaeum sp.]
MAVHILQNTKIYIDGVDLSGRMNNVTLNYSAELKDKTTFGSSSMRRIPGLLDVAITGQGFYDASTQYQIDNVSWNDVASTDQIMTVVAQGTALGNIAFSAKKISYEYQNAFQIGEIAAVNFACYGVGALIRQRLMEAGAISTSLSATPRNLGYRGPQQNLFATLHVIRGTTDSDKNLIVEVITDSSSGFGVGPTTAITFTTLTTAPHVSQWQTTSQSTTHNWYKISVVSSGSSDGTINGVVTLGNQ